VINFFILDLPILDAGSNGIAGHSFHIWANQRADPSRLSLTAKCRCRALANEIDDSPALHHAGKVKRVPIGETDATMRFSLADFFRRRSTVDAVTRRREIDPN
jgi:hypothetical protein